MNLELIKDEVQKIYNFIDDANNDKFFLSEWFDNEYNYCQNDMLDNIIRISNIDQKNKIIAKLSKSDKISVKNFLAGLGYDDAICFFIDGYLNVESIKQTFMFRNTFGLMKKK